MVNLQFRLSGYRFQPSWLGTLLTLCAIPFFIKLGLWQYHKATQKQALQTQYDRWQHAAPVALPEQLGDVESWRYRRVIVRGSYEAGRQILLDNQVYGEQVGYHVLTPLQIENSKKLVLVDRGWIAALPDHRQLPDVPVPAGVRQVSGQVWLPGKFYALAPEAGTLSADGRSVWQNLDIARYASAVSAEVLPLVIRLDAAEPDGYGRDWPLPAEHITTHIGYAYQWFGFAVAAFLIYLYVSTKKVNS